MNFNVLVLSKFRTKLSATNHLIISDRTKFDSEQIFSKLLLAITTLVSTANNIHSDAEFIVKEMPFIYTMNDRDPRIDPWELHVSICPTQRKNVELNYVVTSTSCLLLVK